MSHPIKMNLEITWLCVQIIAVISAAIWAIFVWDSVEEEQAKPRFLVSMQEQHIVSSWFDENSRSSCKIQSHWELSNTGNTPITIKDIGYSLYAIADNNTAPQRAEAKDMSVGRLIKTGQLIARKDLLPSEDFAISGGKISRDITVLFQPDSDNPEQWFNTHKVAFVITSVVDKYGKLWCPFCDDTEFKTSDIQSLQYVCSEESPTFSTTK